MPASPLPAAGHPAPFAARLTAAIHARGTPACIGLDPRHESLPPALGAAQIAATDTAALAAISAGAVFMGANTYIGNAPNFMVYAIARQRGVKMPGFFGYMLWSGAVLIPCFLLTTLVFF